MQVQHENTANMRPHVWLFPTRSGVGGDGQEIVDRGLGEGKVARVLGLRRSLGLGSESTLSGERICRGLKNMWLRWCRMRWTGSRKNKMKGLREGMARF